MKKLTAEKRAEVSKMSTERLRARLIKTGYDEDDTVETERGDLLNTYAEYLVTPSLPESPEKAGTIGSVSETEIEFRRQEESEYRNLSGDKQKRNDKEKRRKKNWNDKHNEMSWS